MDNSNKPRILIVDDNPFNRELLKEFIEPGGFCVAEGRNGKEALEHLQESNFRLIFMDLLMPGMDGFETIRRIRRMGVDTPIIIVSSMTSRDNRQRCLEAGGNDFLPKPIDVEKVNALIGQYGAESPKPATPRADDKEPARFPALDFSNYRILLVEEHDSIADPYSRFLKNLGFEVTRVFNGNEAWELFLANRHRFHIIITNVFTSGMDGLGVLAKIKRDYPVVLVFIYAQEHDADTFQLAVQLGADGVITQAEFEISIIDLIESAVYRAERKGSRTQAASTVSQVRQAQAELIKFGCPEPCNSIDIAYSPLTDAGGDLACCRRFNLAGRCGIILGDVAGHNVMSSYISAISLGMLTSNWDRNQNPLKLLKLINAELNKSDYDKYHLCTTALLWDRRRQKIKIGTAGNPGGFFVMKTKEGSLDFRELSGGGMCLGLLKDDHLFLSEETEFNEDAYLFLFSDGIRKKDIMDILSSGSVCLDRKNIRGLCQEILDRILDKSGQNDDMVLIALKSLRGGWKGPDAGAREGNENSELHYELLSTYKAADKACKWAVEQCVPEKIPKGKDPCLVFLAAREALINAVRYGNKFNPDAFIDLSLFFDHGELRIEISDEGPGFQLPDTVKKIEDIDVLQSGGRGLAVMYSVADAVNVAGGTISLVFREKGV
ncbi:response regulator [Desulfobacterales bacterium HSG2]|nr:response regulator [Desulfobacterales bacterium HSG2]